MTALIFGLKQFRQYLLGRHFLVRTDHMAITYYHKMKDATGQAARYLDFLSNFTFDIQYREGARHTNADSLSRIRPCEVAGGEPCKQCNRRITGSHAIKTVRTRAQAASDYRDATAAAEPQQADGDTTTCRRRRQRKHKPRVAASLNSTAPSAWPAANNWSLSYIREKQMEDSGIGPAIVWVEAGVRLIGQLWRAPRLCCAHYGTSLTRSQ